MYSHLWHDSFLHVTRSRIRSKWALSRSLQSPPKHPTHPRPPHPTTSSAPDHRQAHLCAHSIALFLTSDELHHTSASHTHSAARALGSPSVAAVNRTRACAVEVSDYEPPTPSLSTPAHKSRAVAPQLRQRRPPARRPRTCRAKRRKRRWQGWCGNGGDNDGGGDGDCGAKGGDQKAESEKEAMARAAAQTATSVTATDTKSDQ